MAPTSPRSPLTPARGARTANSASRRWGTVPGKATKKGHDPTEGDGVFAVSLMVAAVGEGDILTDGSRKTREVLENISRFVSKEQNTTVHVSGEGKPIDIKMRVFVQNSIEAKAVSEYMAMHPDQRPAAFVLLVASLDMAVVYSSKGGLDPSSAAVADRLRKQAKTRAVRLVREAIAAPQCAISSSLLRGYGGPHGPLPLLRTYIASRSVPVGGGIAGRKYIAFNAKNKPHEAPRASGKAPQGNASAHHPPPTHKSLAVHPHIGWTPPADPQLSALFPVSLFVTAIADGVVARDTQQKAKERLGLIVSKIPKEQNTTVELAEGTLELKMRVFVSNSEDAKAVSEYIQTHSNQIPSPFVILARDLPMALLYDPASLDLSDASVADRLRKQAKTRAVKLIREVIGDGARTMGQAVLRGHSGATAVSELVEPLVLALAHSVPGQPPHKKFLAFAARSKAGPSPYTSPALPPARRPPSPPPQSLEPLAFDDEACVGALRSLARHRYSEAENAAESAAQQPNGRWWDSVETVKEEGGGEREREEGRGAGQEGARELKTTEWRVCAECSPEQRPASGIGASPSPQLHPVTFSPSVSPKLSAIVLPPLCLSKVDAMDTHEKSVASTTVSPEGGAHRAVSQALSESPPPAQHAASSLSESLCAPHSHASSGQASEYAHCSAPSSEQPPHAAKLSSSCHLPADPPRHASSFLGVSTAALSCTEEMETAPSGADPTVGSKRPCQDRGDAEERPTSVPRTG